MWRLSKAAGIILAIILSIVSCQNKSKKDKAITVMEKRVSDPHSYSQPEEAVVTHLKLELEVDFEQKLIQGIAEIQFDKRAGAQKLILDTKDLDIHDVSYAHGEKANFVLGGADQHLGSALEIALKDAENKVIITYSTGQGAEALQWLEPGQTADKTAPFLFTQSQAILARSWIPLQDSPGIRFTYTAKVQVPKGYLALMSAENPQHTSDDGVYHFKMDQPIPSYLMALAVGNIEFASIGERTGIYAEPSMIEKSKNEFSEMDEMLTIAEKLYGPYRWERYDLIVLPPSFPFGGMENPRITFATPTILAGDKSLTSLVAHELAHSWSGNLVTNATWNDFWLNEGFTVYFETRIMEALKGKDYADMLASLSLQGLLEEVEGFEIKGNLNDTKLKLDLSGRNPDDGVTAIAYDKGYFFLKYLEQYVGREKFDAFLIDYFTEHAFKSNHTEAFLDFLDINLFQKNNIEPVSDLNEWIYGVGLPETLPIVISSRFEKVDQSIAEWTKGNDSFNTEEWSSHEWVYFIKNLPNDISLSSLVQLDEKYHFTLSGNSEILGVWFTLCARYSYKPSFEAMEEFLIHTGRRKFLMPIYQELAKSEKGKAIALDVYKKARPNYHFVASSSLDKLLKS